MEGVKNEKKMKKIKKQRKDRIKQTWRKENKAFPPTHIVHWYLHISRISPVDAVKMSATILPLFQLTAEERHGF